MSPCWTVACWGERLPNSHCPWDVAVMDYGQCPLPQSAAQSSARKFISLLRQPLCPRRPGYIYIAAESYSVLSWEEVGGGRIDYSSVGGWGYIEWIYGCHIEIKYDWPGALSLADQFWDPRGKALMFLVHQVNTFFCENEKMFCLLLKLCQAFDQILNIYWRPEWASHDPAGFGQSLCINLIGFTHCTPSLGPCSHPLCRKSMWDISKQS